MLEIGLKSLNPSKSRDLFTQIQGYEWLVMVSHGYH